MHLKKRDKKLLYELCRDSRQPYTALARKSAMSQQLVSYKIKAMRESGLVGFSYPIIDYSRFGLLRFHVHFRVNYRSSRKLQDIVSFIAGHESVVGVTARGGHYDLIVTFMARNPSSFNKTLRDLIEQNPDQLKNHMILTNVVSHHFPKKYLIGLSDNIKDIIIGGDRDPAQVSKTEMKVLQMLSEDARMRTVDIASRAGINPRTAIGAIKRLRSSGIIRGFSSMLNLRQAGFLQGMMLIKYHNLSVRLEDRLRRFCVTNSRITAMHKLFGDFDVAITAEAENAKERRNIFIQIREEFEDIINDSDSFSLYTTYKRSYLPESFFG
jgi:DNA-binding Lrp family transcriptional regulator